MTNIPSIDRSIFDELVASIGGDQVFLGELIATYLADSPKLIAQMHAALAGDNCDGFRRAAHSLKSTSANFGALTLSTMAKELEMMAKSGTLVGAADKLVQAEEEYARVESELQNR